MEHLSLPFCFFNVKVHRVVEKIISLSPLIKQLGIMGKLMFFLYFILSVFPTDAIQNRRHIHVVRRGSKKSHRGNTVAKIWIEENGQKKIEIAWSELTGDEEAEILKAIDEHWEELNRLIDDVFAGKKIQIKRIK